MRWLVKEEPSSYSFADLERDGRTAWAGVRNALAQQHLRAMKAGDRVFFYHTGGEKAVVGIAKVVTGPRPDPADSSGTLQMVELAPVRRLKTPVTLAAIKTDPAFADFALVRISRLSVMPVTDREWAAIEALSKRP
jgi:predicted RNA-binding protein with PUA-like domain